MNAWLVTAYAALALGLAWVIAGGAGWKWRAPYVVAAPALALALWLGRPDAAGWPSLAAMPAHAELHWAVVDEPDPAASDPGRIYLWLDVGAAKPRAFSLPYSRKLHEQLQRALKQVQQGRPVKVTRAPARRHPGKGGSGAGDRGALRFTTTPPPGLPPKASEIP